MAGQQDSDPATSTTTPTTSTTIQPRAIPATTSSSAPPPTRPLASTLQLRRSSSGANARLSRQVTTQERLVGILELGRQRAESMSPGRSPPAGLSFRGPGGSTPPTTTADPSSNNHHYDTGGAFGERVDDEDRSNDQEPDETTGIVMKGARHRSAPSAMNYQSTVTMESAGARARRNGAANTGRRREGINGVGNGSGNGHGNGNGNGNGSGNGNGNGNGPDEAPERGDADFDADNKEAAAWWKTQLARFGSIELENKGSVARDHLALERTFLAWLRTSLSFASIGVAITQLFRLNTSLAEDGSSSSRSGNAKTLAHLGKPLGAIFLGISILMLFLGYHRYFQAQQWIIKGKFPASRGTVILVSLLALCLMVISLTVVLLVQPTTSSS